MKAVVLAATRGTQLGPLTATRPKALCQVAGQSPLGYHLRDLREVGVSEVHLVTGYRQQAIREQLGNGSQLGLQLRYHHQAEQTGIGQALSLVREQLASEDYFLLIYSDHVAPDNLVARALAFHQANLCPVAVVSLAQNNQAYGNVFLGEDSRISQLIEKPADSGMGNYILAGVFVVPRKVFDYLEHHNGNMVAALHQIVATDAPHAVIYDGDWTDIDYPWSLLNANQVMMRSWRTASIDASITLEANVSLSGPALIEEGVTIKAGSIIQGPCFIGKGSFIGNNTLVRPFTSIGPGCTIGYGVELKNCVFFGGSTVGRLSFIGDSIIGSGARIGSGVMTVNETEQQGEISLSIEGQSYSSGQRKLGSFIGDGACVGASNTLGPGTVIPAQAVLPHRTTYDLTELSSSTEPQV